MKKLFCFHRTITIMRAHKKSPYAIKKESQGVAPSWIDHYKVYNYVVCDNCGKNLKFAAPPKVYGE